MQTCVCNIDVYGKIGHFVAGVGPLHNLVDRYSQHSHNLQDWFLALAVEESLKPLVPEGNIIGHPRVALVQLCSDGSK